MRARRLSIYSSVLLTLALTCAAQSLPNGVKKVASVEGITEYQLPDGLKVLLFPDPSKPKVTVNMTYLVGSRHEGYGETGMAHYLEHMMFKSTKTRPDIKKDITDRGADWNGTTDWDRTNYFETLPATDENLKWAVELEADRMVNCRIDPDELKAEMTVVRNEWEMGENSPMRALIQRTMSVAYDWHNYGKSPIGAKSDIEKVPVDRLRAFYQYYYQPDDAVLTVAGKFDEPKALALIAQTFAAVPKPTRVLRQTYTEEPTQDGERTVAVRRVGDVQAVSAMFKIPAAAHPDTAALDVLDTILGDNPSGRLYKALVDNKKASMTGMFSQSLKEGGMMMAFAQLQKEQSLDDARDTLLKTIASVISEPPNKEEVERAKTKILKQTELNLTNSERIGLFLSEYSAQGDWRLLFLERDEVKKVTDADVLRVAKAYLKDSNRTVGMFLPTDKPDRAEIPAPPDVASVLKDYKGGAALEQGEAFDPTPANIEGRLQRSKLPDGMKVDLLPKKTRGGNVVAFINLRFGNEKDLFGKSATAQLAGAMLMRGTTDKNRQQIQDAIDKLKARININGGPTGATASIETTEANLIGALRLTAEILRHPSFPDNEIEQVRQQRITALEASRREPQAVAFREIQRHIAPYPRGDVRYTGTADEQIEDLKKVTLDDIRKFYADFYGASNSEFIVSGQFNPADVKTVAAELFGDWKSPRPFAEVVSEHRTVASINKNLETPDKQNAMFIAAYRFPMTDEDADYPALELANYILGGNPGSRMFKRIRDKEGLSYGTGTQMAIPTKENGAVFMGFAISAPANSPKVETSFKDELARTLKDGFTADEIAAAKKSWLEEEKVQRSQDQFLVRTLSSREHWDRTMKWDETIEAKVEALTPEQVSEAFRKHVDASALSFVKAGDFKKAGVFQN
jgi:zinc protease